MPTSTTSIATDDGTCPAHVFTPSTVGPWPAVLFFMDGIGIRPALFTMGERMAAAGYYVLLPDLFYRGGPYPPMNAAKLFSDPEARAEMSRRLSGLVSVERIMRDTRAFLAHFDAQADVKPGKRGVTGYCMGGRMSLSAAGHFPLAFAAAASYHGANLANDAPDSPHLLAAKIQARIYVAGATEDASFPDEQKQRLEAALTEAGVAHTIETYPAKHGWVPSDTPVHDDAQAERHWTTLLDLFARTL
jgi:carboxymethylenebutenolidase